MPIVAASNGIKPYIRALAVIELNKPVTPAEINAHVGTGDYAAKYISFLKNREGFVFTIQKSGREVVSYTLIQEPAHAASLRAMQPKSKGSKPAKVAVAKAAKPVKSASKASPVAVKPRKVDVVEQEFGSSGEVSSYGIDADFDSMDGIDIKSIIV
jgi:hypothetical protein